MGMGLVIAVVIAVAVAVVVDSTATQHKGRSGQSQDFFHKSPFNSFNGRGESMGFGASVLSNFFKRSAATNYGLR